MQRVSPTPAAGRRRQQPTNLTAAVPCPWTFRQL